MSPGPEKRSEEWRRRNLAGIHELLVDSDFDRIGVLSNDDARFLFDEIRETRAALAASRADAERLNAKVEFLYERMDTALAETWEKAAEVSQLRAEVERYRKAGCTIIGIANVTDALAEPLGSTPGQEQTK